MVTGFDVTFPCDVVFLVPPCCSQLVTELVHYTRGPLCVMFYLQSHAEWVHQLINSVELQPQDSISLTQSLAFDLVLRHSSSLSFTKQYV
jgi:hypothetical protein